MTREQIDAIRARVDDGFPPPSSLDTALLLAEVERLKAEVERLTADPLPAAAWVREVERAAFQRGVAAMREAAAKECWNASDELADVPDMETEQGTLQNVAYHIRAIPDPEDTNNQQEKK